MLRISKLSDYAILLLVSLHEAGGDLLSAHTLADASHLELPTASKLLKLLHKANLVESRRGASGGYRLAVPADEISVVDVITAIEGPIAMTECSIEAGLCSQEDRCQLRSNWQRISLTVQRALREVSLADMTRPLPKAGIPGLQIATLNA